MAGKRKNNKQKGMVQAVYEKVVESIEESKEASS